MVGSGAHFIVAEFPERHDKLNKAAAAAKNTAILRSSF
jgi:hypothetical protein